ncbi:MAG TPA: hypothetical protein VGG03_27470 [Thermoanaerobaculia bacterium]|jgi:hypothetical protein
MTALLEKALRSDRALAMAEERLIRRARELYRLGFSPANLAPSQMAAVGELLCTASNRKGAQAAIETWMSNQLKKLREEAERKGKKPRSWLVPPGPGGSTGSLGEELLAWIKDDAYLGEPLAGDLDRLGALRRFWERLHGFYRYENETGGEMPLSALDLQEEGGEPR